MEAGGAGFGLLALGLAPPDFAIQCGGWKTCVNRLAWGSIYSVVLCPGFYVLNRSVLPRLKLYFTEEEQEE
jgi:hypothetical protein